MGNLAKEKFGFSAPVWSPMFPKAPWLMPRTELIVMFYEAEKEAVLNILPDECELLTEPPVVTVILKKAIDGHGGPHYGNYIVPQCKFRGKPYIYDHFLLITNDVAMVMGREYWGDPKKICYTDWYWEGNELLIKTERPRGLNILTAHFRIEKQCAIEHITYPIYPNLSLKYIPSSERDGKPDVFKYIEGKLELLPLPEGTVEVWRGTGSIWMPSPTEVLPIYKLAPKKILGAFFIKCGIKVLPGKVINDFNREA